MREAYLHELSSALKQHQPQETILLMGSRAEGRRALAALAAQGNLIIGVRPETPFSLAQELCADQLSAAGAPRLLSEVEAADLVRSCMSKSTGIYSGVNVRTLTAARTVFRTFQEMAMADVPEELEAHPAVQSSGKLRELQAIRSAYREAKREKNLLDRADLFHLAIETAKAQPGKARRPWFVTLGDYAPTPLERQLLDLLTGDRLTVVPLPCADGVKLPAGAMAPSLPRVDVLEAVRSAQPRFAACRGVETEVRALFRDLLAEKETKLEDCTVVSLSGSYAQTLYEEAARFHIPVSMGGGLPMTGSRLYTSLKAVAELPRTDFFAEDVCRLLETFCLTPEWPVKLAERLRAKKVGWGKERYGLACAPADIDEGRPETMGDEAWKLLVEDWTGFLALLTAVAEPEAGLERQREELLDFLCYCNHKSMAEAAALAKARELVTQVSELDRGETLLRRLLVLMEGASYLGGAPEPGKLYCAPMSQAAFAERKRLYVLGLTRYAVRGEQKESPVLLDAERMALGALKTSAQLGEDREYRLMTLLARHEGELVLTYPDYDSDKMLEQAPAPFFQEASKGFPVVRVSHIPETDLTPMDCMASAQEVVSMSGAKPWALQEGEKAELQEKKTVKELLEGMMLSPSALETALRCPYKFYLQYLLCIRTPQAVERNDQQWLAPNETGSFVHGVMEQVYQKGQTKQWEEIFEEEFEHLEKTVPLPHKRLKDETKQTLKEMVQRAVKWTTDSQRTVESVEQHFEDLPLTLGQWNLRLKGSIDRVDKLPDGELAILDYKTGRMENYTDEMYRHLQHYLYTLAEEQLHGTSITQAGYLFLKEETKLVPLEENKALREEMEERITWLLDRISEENYPLECQPCFVPLCDDDGNPIPGVMVCSDNKDALKNCKKNCEFAAVCPA